MDAAHDLEALAKRVEVAAGPDRDLDCLTAVGAMGFIVEPPKHEGGDVRYCRYDSDGDYVMPGQAGDMLVPRLTASIDAAMSVVPDGLFPTIDFVTKRCWLRDANGCDVPHGPAYGFAKTVPASIVAASLRALSQGVNDDHA